MPTSHVGQRWAGFTARILGEGTAVVENAAGRSHLALSVPFQFLGPALAGHIRSGTGMASSSKNVYGCLGQFMTSSHGPSSTITA